MLEGLRREAVVQHFLVRQSGIGREEHAPEAGWPIMRHLEDRAPIDRIGDIGVERIAMGREVLLYADDEKALRPGEALEGDIHQMPHRAARAVGADEIGAARRLDAAGGLEPRGDAVCVLRRVDEAMREFDLAAQRLEALLQQRRQLELLAMEAERVGRLVFEQREIPFDDNAFRAATDLPARHLDADGEEILSDADRLEHLEGRRMDRAGAQIARQLFFGFEDAAGNACLRQDGGNGETGGAGADDDDWIATGQNTPRGRRFSVESDRRASLRTERGVSTAAMSRRLVHILV